MNVNCAHHRIADIASLTLNPKNANKHPENQIKLLAKILKFQGWRHPVVVSKRSGFVVAGHGRIEAARLNGWESVPVDDQEFENEAAEYAFLISDNTIAELAETDLAMVNELALEMPKDFDLELLGIPDFEIIETEVLEPQCDEDSVGELPAEPKTKLGDVYQLGRHRLMCGDSTSIDAVEKLMSMQKIDLVFTDPPYGISVVHGKGNYGTGVMAKAGSYMPVLGDETTEVAIDSVNLCLSLKIPKLVFWGANYYASALPDGKKWIVWDKKRPEGTTFSDCELAWTNLEGGIKKYEFLWHGMMQEGVRETRVHPTQKPVGLIEKILPDFDGQKVLDLFGGSGSTLIACEKTGRTNFSMELDPKYCDVIVNRWEKYTGKKAELLNG